jgi:hypothetical protein
MVEERKGGVRSFAKGPGPTVQDPSPCVVVVDLWCMDAPRRDTNQMPALLYNVDIFL